MSTALSVSLEITRRGKTFLRFKPHGYPSPIELPVITSGTREGTGSWTWNGSLDKPTLRPSIQTTHGETGLISHLWLNDGICQHLGDSTDGLAGQTLPLLPLGWQCDHGDEGMDHDWSYWEDTSGEVDGGPGDTHKWKECRACGCVATRDDEPDELTRLRASVSTYVKSMEDVHWHLCQEPEPDKAREILVKASNAFKESNPWLEP